MIKVILASHGYYSKGMLSSLEIIMGKQNNISTICGYVDDNNVEEEIDKLINENKDNELIVFTDLLGGSVNNIFLKYINNKNLHLIAGANLAVLIEIVNIIDQEDVWERIKEIVNKAGKSIVLCDEELINGCSALSDF